MTTRIQLSLFVPPSASAPLEALRRVLDPVQASLIPAHVTLCRDDECVGLDDRAWRARLETAGTTTMMLRFGAPERFHGHGVLLPCVEGEGVFRELRRQVLGAAPTRRQAPHITLAHPRNPQATGNTAENIARVPLHLKIELDRVCRIEQVDDGPWKVLEQFRLGVAEPDGSRA